MENKTDYGYHLKPCTNCNGSGKNYHAPKSSSATLPPCVTCRGTGLMSIKCQVKSPKMKADKKKRLIKLLFSANK